jgi:hypothetical protein
LISVDVTIVNVALPTLARSLGATTTQLQWVVDAYSLVFAALVLAAGSLSDRQGRKGTLLIGLGVFAAGSVAGALAGTTSELIAARAVMGLGAALMFPSKVIVASGLLFFAAGLLWTATVSASTSYTTIALQMLVLGTGMGLTSAPATEAIMGAVPKAKAGAGSAVNDATRLFGGTLGVAVIGSVAASLYSSRLASTAPATCRHRPHPRRKHQSVRRSPRHASLPKPASPMQNTPWRTALQARAAEPAP